MKLKTLFAFALAAAATATAPAPAVAADKLLNVSYDVARNVYKDLNPAFIAAWKQSGGGEISVDQSHGGSSKQARAVIDGLQADVLSMNSSLDIDAVAKSNLLSRDWSGRLPYASSPSWSTILFVVRKGNPKNIRDWNDLSRPDVSIVLPNPKTSGNGRYSYLAAWQYALRQPGGSEAKAREFLRAFLGNAPVLDTGGRGATTTFAQREIGDVLLTFENEVALITEELGPEKFDVVVPSLSVRADNPVAVVDKVVDRKGTRKAAEAYLEFHFSPAGQEIFARNNLRPSDPAILKKYADRFPSLQLFTIDEAFGGWEKAQKVHFAEGGTFDQIIQSRQ